MCDQTAQRATYEDLMQVPDHLVAEIIDGVLYSLPRPAVPHANAASELGVTLGGAFRSRSGGPGDWKFLDEPELHVGQDIVVPDLAGWRRERMGRLPNAAYLEIVPDWVCEVLSPSTKRLDRGNKMVVYAREGVSHLWLIDPIRRTLEVYERDDGLWRPVALFGDSAVVRAVPFDTIEIDLAWLWI